MAEQQGSDHDTCLDHGQAFNLPALISPLVAGVIIKDVRRCAGDFAATVPAIMLCPDAIQSAGGQILQFSGDAVTAA